ncbi:MAG: DUF4365 domain-containing protein [Chloroflexi bacterium]|nr:DUF4365 domain-containing protein [Chloroflexota bacterium]
MQPLDYLKMEFLQVAYVNAVVANAGKSCDTPRRDAGIDIRVVDWIQNPQNPNRYEDGGVVFNCQLKASTRCSFKDGNLIFPMKVRDYNKLVNWPGVGIKILVAFNMPKDPETWFSQNREIMCLRHCCYWTELTGQAQSSNKPDSSKSITIPEDSVFDSQTVLELIERTKQDKYS